MVVPLRTPAASPVPAPSPPGNEARVLAATITCISRWGLGKTTLEDIAREAGLSRATVYRLFPGGRDVVVKAALTAELRSVEVALADGLLRAATTEDRLVLLVAGLVGAIRRHPALQAVLAHEPEHVLAHLAFGRLDAVLAAAGDRMAPWLGDDRRAGEWVARNIVSYAFTPSPRIDLEVEADARRFVRTFLLPALERSHG